jgi:hypothetical protein
MSRIPVKLPHDGSTIQGKLDHTGYALFDVELSDAPALKLSGGLPPGVAGGIALLGRNEDKLWKDLGGVQPQGGHTSVTLPDPGRFDRITAVVVNASYDTNGWNGSDWNWTEDQQPIELTVSEVTGGGGEAPGGGEQTPGGGEQTPGGGGQTPGGTHQTPGGDRPPVIIDQIAPLVRVTPGVAPRLRKASALKLSANASTGGRFSARATVDARTAKALGLGRKAATVGSGAATLASGGTAKLTVKLTGKARARLKKARKAVTVTVKVSFAPSAGAPTTTTLKVRLKP